MRSKKKFGIALVAALAFVLAGCTNSATDPSPSPTSESVTCGVVNGALNAAEDDLEAANEKLEDEDVAGTPATVDIDSAIASLEVRIADLKETKADCRAKAAAEAKAAEKKKVAKAALIAKETALAQCRTDALVAYMTTQGFADGQYVVGEERLDRTAPEFSRQGSFGFRQDEAIPDTRKKLQESFDSKAPNLVTAADAVVQMFPDISRKTLLNAQNWEIVQTTVDSEIMGNTGLNGSSLIDAGNTASKAGDASWIFIDVNTCTVPRATVDVTGAPVDPALPEAEKPVGSYRPGCINPNEGFRLKPPPVSVTPGGTTPGGSDAKDPADNVDEPYGVTEVYTLNEETNGHQSSDQIASGDTSGNAGTNQVGSDTTSGSTTPDTGTTVVVGGASTTPEDTSGDPQDSGNTNPDTGTGGDPKIAPPPD